MQKYLDKEKGSILRRACRVFPRQALYWMISSSGIMIAAMIYAKSPVPQEQRLKKAQSNLIIVESILKYTPIPPQTPQNILSLDDLYSFLLISTS